MELSCNQSVKDRIMLFISKSNITKSEFERNSGLSNGYLNQLRNMPKEDKISKILGAYPEINRVWLLTGEGEMLQKHPKTANGSNGKKYISDEMIKEGDYSGTLVYDIDATCGMENREIDFANEDVIGSINLPFISKNSVIIRANGDSMQPKICDGDLVAIREIFSWDDVYYGQIYMVLLDEYRMIKYIRRCAEDEEHYIILRSENDNYDDIKLHKSKIRKLFLVENILSIKNQL